MNGSKLVSQVNCELAGILDNELSRIGVIREQPPADVLATRLNSTSGILVPTRRGLRSPDYARLEALLDQIADFWNERITDYLQAVSGLPGLTICSRAPRSDLCCFFDTVIYSDSASGIALLKEERTLSDIMLAVDALNDMKPLLPLMAQGGEPPAIATIPFHPPLFGLQVPDANAADLNFTPLQPEYEKLLVEYLTEHARMDARPASVLEWASKIPIDASRTLDDVLDLDVLRPLVIPEDSTYLSKQRQPRASLQNRDQYPGAQRFEECIAGRSIALDKYGQWTGFRIGWEIGSGLFHVLAHEQVCAAVNSSPYIEHARLYMLFLELTAGRIAKAFQLRNDVAVARSITLPPFHWLGDLSPEEVMRLREAGV